MSTARPERGRSKRGRLNSTLVQQSVTCAHKKPPNGKSQNGGKGCSNGDRSLQKITQEERYMTTIPDPIFPIRPVLGRVIIKLETSGEKISEAGIITTLDSDRTTQRREGLDRVGVVVAFDSEFYDSERNASYQEPGNQDGPGAYVQKQNKPDIKIGDRIFFAVSWAGDSFEWEGSKYHVLEGEDAALLVSAGVEIEAATR